jgi:hypothetical protein
MRVVCLPFWAALFVAFANVSFGFDRPGHAELEDFDKRLPAAAVAPAPNQARLAGAASLKQRLPQLAVDYDPIVRAPKAVIARDGFLTGPKGRGRGVSRDAKLAAVADHDPLLPLKGMLNEHRQLFGHSAEELDRARLKRHHTAKHNGLRSYAWQQERNGIAIYDAVLSAHITKGG